MQRGLFEGSGTRMVERFDGHHLCVAGSGYSLGSFLGVGASGGNVASSSIGGIVYNVYVW